MRIISFIVKTILKVFAYLLPVQKVFLFESCPDLADNTKPVFDELVKMGVNKKYRFIWMCSDRILDSYPIIENVQYLDVNKHKVKAFLLNHRAKIVIFCNRFIGSNRKDQKVFFITHGGPLKDTRNYYTSPDYIDWMITCGEGINDLFAKYTNTDINKCVALGYPRNDILVKTKKDLSVYFGEFSKYVIWYPTVKQFKSGMTTGSKFPIPIIHNNDSLIKLNNFALSKNMLIIIKPHFAQMAGATSNSNLSNIIFLDDTFFKNNNITSYELVGSCDSLITDYSSIYYDFTACNKPIGMIWEDIEDFAKNPGLVDRFYEVTKGAEKIYNISDLLMFLDRVFMGVDLLYNDRNEVCDMSNRSKDGKSTERVTKFILETSGIAADYIHKEEN